jgi:hypothetical protein
MASINIDSKQSIFFGVHFIVAGNWTADPKQFLHFQQELLKETLEFAETAVGPQSFLLLRKEPSALQVKVASLGPQVSEIRISTPARPVHGLDYFSEEAEAVCRAYEEVWGSAPCQIIRYDVGVRHLYSCECHAFQYLWENRLGQQQDDLKYLGRPILGGGLRLVLPRTKEHAEDVEVKIESFLEDQRKMFVETLFVWPTPHLASKAEDFGPRKLLEAVDKYATNEVCDFLLKREKEDQNASNG